MDDDVDNTSGIRVLNQKSDLHLSFRFLGRVMTEEDGGNTHHSSLQVCLLGFLVQSLCAARSLATAMQGFPGVAAMAMPAPGVVFGGQHSSTPGSNGEGGGGETSENEQSYETRLEIAHQHAVDAASKDAKRACQPGVNVPFVDLDDAIARLLPYHVFSAPDEDALDMSVVPGGVVMGGDDDGKEKTENENNEDSAKAVEAKTRSRSRAQAWGESKRDFVVAFSEELEAKRQRLEGLISGRETRGDEKIEKIEDASDAFAKKEKDACAKTEKKDEFAKTEPGHHRNLAAAEEYLVAAKTLEVAKRRDTLEKNQRAMASAEQKRVQEQDRFRQQQAQRAEAEQRRAAQVDAQRRALVQAEANSTQGLPAGIISAQTVVPLGTASAQTVAGSSVLPLVGSSVLPSTVVGHTVLAPPKSTGPFDGGQRAPP